MTNYNIVDMTPFLHNIDFEWFLCKLKLETHHFMSLFMSNIYSTYISMLSVLDMNEISETGTTQSLLFTVSKSDCWKMNVIIFLYEHFIIILALYLLKVLFYPSKKDEKMKILTLKLQLLEEEHEKNMRKFNARKELLDELGIKLAKEKLNTFVLKKGGSLSEIKGWKIVERARTDCSRDDKYYYSEKGQRFRSLNEISKYLNLGEE